MSMEVTTEQASSFRRAGLTQRSRAWGQLLSDALSVNIRFSGWRHPTAGICGQDGGGEKRKVISGARDGFDFQTHFGSEGTGQR